ncbi:hypothetical protein F4860DRAFT_217287 [Xylaria cubensis]|nr:hypothetical protein F4860DRAFT_217287 [Xylaria cubensis]
MEIPQCATNCLNDAIERSSCAPSDLLCNCAAAARDTLINTCVSASCTIRDSLITQHYTMNMCGVHPRVNYTYEPILITSISLASVAVSLRFVARFVTETKLWWDDYANFGAMLTDIAYTSIALSAKPRGFGTDLWAVPPDNIEGLLKGIYAASTLYAIARILVRISILLFYLRIFRASRARIVIIGTVVFILVEGVAFTIPTLLQCSPVAYFWERWDGLHQGRCIDPYPLVLISGIFGVLVDTWLIAVPIPFVVRLQLPWQKKILISSMFAVGIIVIGISLARFPSIKQFTTGKNVTFDSVPITLFSGLENGVGVTCACLPSLRGLFGRLLSQYTKTSPGSKPALIPNDINPKLKSIKSKISTTTTIQQQIAPAQHGAYVPLDELDLGTTSHGYVQTNAWSLHKEGGTLGE